MDYSPYMTLNFFDFSVHLQTCLAKNLDTCFFIQIPSFNGVAWYEVKDCFAIHVVLLNGELCWKQPNIRSKQHFRNTEYLIYTKNYPVFKLILVCKIRVFSVLAYAISNTFLFFLLTKYNVIRIGRDTTRQKTILLIQLFNCTAFLGIQ